MNNIPSTETGHPPETMIKIFENISLPLSRMFTAQQTGEVVQPALQERRELPTKGFVCLATILATSGPITISETTWWAGVNQSFGQTCVDVLSLGGAA